MVEQGERTRKGASLGDATAKKEFGLDQEAEIEHSLGERAVGAHVFVALIALDWGNSHGPL